MRSVYIDFENSSFAFKMLHIELLVSVLSKVLLKTVHVELVKLLIQCPFINTCSIRDYRFSNTCAMLGQRWSTLNGNTGSHWRQIAIESDCKRI